MKNKKMTFNENPITFILFPVLFTLGVISYYRFFIYKDYFIGYDAKCDPRENSCFVVCEDDECSDESYSVHMTKYASDLYNQCGEDITNCKNAEVCLPTDIECSVEYCNPEKELLCSVKDEFQAKEEPILIKNDSKNNL